MFCVDVGHHLAYMGTADVVAHVQICNQNDLKRFHCRNFFGYMDSIVDRMYDPGIDHAPCAHSGNQ